jgi:ATP-binding cassette subfamily B protein
MLKKLGTLIRYRFPNYRQLDSMDCGPTCLKIVSKYYGSDFSLEYLRDLCSISREGVNLKRMKMAAEEIGFETIVLELGLKEIDDKYPLPFIAHWRQDHFVVVYRISRNNIYISDPAYGLLKLSAKEFEEGWVGSDQSRKGIALFLEPNENFQISQKSNSSYNFLKKYLTGFKIHYVYLIIGLIIGSLIQVSLPILAQLVVDIGIEFRNTTLILVFLLGQLVLFIGKISFDYVRSWILLRLGTKLNISIISDFLVNLVKLPISFFDKHLTGDLMQRINDHSRIELFMTSSSLSTLFSFISIIVFGIVLAYYNINIFFIYLVGSTLYFLWIILFIQKRRELDYKKFDQQSDNHSFLINFLSFMPEIKLLNIENKRRREWESIQLNIFKLKLAGLKLDQMQFAGSNFIIELTNIIITFIAAVAVINGNFSLGSLIAVQFIIGQLSAPISQMASFIYSAQDAKISLERLSELHSKDIITPESYSEIKIKSINDHEYTNGYLELSNVSFSYGNDDNYVLKEVNYNFPFGKKIAIVGSSGSGKTTLLKLIMRFYDPSIGVIKFNENELKSISIKAWRHNLGVVLQEGVIFPASILENIGIKDDNPDLSKAKYAAQIANIKEFIDSLPLGYDTKLGSEGHDLSQGQKQRILIARAVYSNPKILIFDEATNALDTTNEKIITENLGRITGNLDNTMIVVAHRLSTVKDADEILVLDKGKIVETGKHEMLIEKKGFYYELIKNQLELNNGSPYI